MEPVTKLLATLHALDVKLWADGRALRYDAPRDVLTPDLLDQMREHKAEILAFLHRDHGVSPETIPPAPRNQELPLSSAQQRLWFLEQLELGKPTYSIVAAYCLTGSLNVSALEQSLKELIQRHEILRTTFPSVDGQPIQVISPEADFVLTVINLEECPLSEREVDAQQHGNAIAQQSFDLERGPLFRATLLRLSDQDHRLLLNMHHIVSDGWSSDVSFRELATLYKGFTDGPRAPLPQLPIQYADFASWQQNCLQGPILASQLKYWTHQLRGELPVLHLPTDHPRPPKKTYRGAYQPLELSNELTQALKGLSQRSGVTLFMLLLASFQVLLFRYSGQTDLIIGTPIAGRHQPEIEGLIGFFSNTLALRTDLSGNPSFRELLDRVRQVALDAYTHQDLPFEKLLEALQSSREQSYTPLFQVMFVFQKASQQVFKLPQLTVIPLEIHTGTAKFDLTLELQETEQGLRGQFEYSTDLFDADTIIRMIGHFQTLLEGIIAYPEQAIASLPLLTSEEYHQLVVEWNNTSTAYPRNTCVHQLFEAQVEHTPDAIAVDSPQEQITYHELNERANQLAHYLQKLGVRPDIGVGICVERSPLMIIGLLAILKAGGAYVPLNPTYPVERLTFMLEDTQVPVVLTQQSLIAKLPRHEAHIICLDTEADLINQHKENLLCEVTADNLAYITYTSGSTGRPKGVCVIHRGVVRLVKGTHYANLDATETFLQLAPLAFDASTFEIWGSLLSGARLVLFPAHLPTLKELSQVIEQFQVTTLWLTSGLFQLMVDEQLAGLKPLRQLLAGGDVLSVAHVQKFLQEADTCQLINGYGPTENTTFSCCYRVSELSPTAHSIPIGRAISNTQVYILDPYLNPVPIGVPGELYVGGDGLARGYLNQPELTEAKFVPDPFWGLGGDRLYKTGDLARYLPDGNIEFLGRIDNQVKIRGFRIELGEIEAALAQHPLVEQAVVIDREDSPQEKRLVAYLVLNSSSEASDSHTQITKQLRGFLQKKLPGYMVPSVCVPLKALPLMPNGKVDRHRLPVPDATKPGSEVSSTNLEGELESELTKIWEDLLGIRPISPQDNFFDIGGNSLIAVRLFIQIEKTFGRNLPLSTLFQSATIEGLGHVIRDENWLGPWSSIVTMQQGDSRLPPLFYMHAGGGNLLVYRDLAINMGPDQPIYGLQPRGLDGKYNPDICIEDMAAHYVVLIRNRQPNGPYFLAGLSAGGLVALEVAQRLRKLGQEVELLALLDTYGPDYPQLLPLLPRFLSVLRYVLFDVGIWRAASDFCRTELSKIGTRIKELIREKIRGTIRRLLLSVLNPQQVTCLKKFLKRSSSEAQISLDYQKHQDHQNHCEHQDHQDETSDQREQVVDPFADDSMLHKLYLGQQNKVGLYLYNLYPSHLNFLEKHLNLLIFFLLERATTAYYATIFLKSLVHSTSPLPEVLRKVQQAHLRAAEDYRPKIYLGRAMLFRAINQPPGIRYNRYLGWDGIFTEGIEVHDIPGVHHTVVESPIVAQILKSYIENYSNKEPT